MKQRNLWIGLLLISFAAFGLVGCAQESASEKVEPAELVDQGDGRNLVILTEHAAQRLGIQTEEVGEEEMMVKRTYGGEVAEANPTSGALVMVSLAPQEKSMVDTAIPAYIFPLGNDDEEDDDMGEGIAAELDESSGLDDDEDDDTDVLYYSTSGQGDFVVGQRLMVEVALKGEQGARLVVPFSSLLYDINGETYVYISPEPLKFLRVPVVVERIEDDKVILEEGPAAGTNVVTVGAVELYGADTGVGK